MAESSGQVKVVCPICETVHYFSATETGREKACEFCGHKLVVPSPPSPPAIKPQPKPEPIPLAPDEWWKDEKVVGRRHVHTLCPRCEAQVVAPLDKAGEEVSCPECSQKVLMPMPQEDPWGVAGESVPWVAPAASAPQKDPPAPVEAAPADSDDLFASQPIPAQVVEPAPQPAQSSPPSSPPASTGSAVLDRVLRPPAEPPSVRGEVGPSAPSKPEPEPPPPWNIPVHLLAFPWSNLAALRGMFFYLLLEGCLIGISVLLGLATDGKITGGGLYFSVFTMLVILGFLSAWLFHIVETGIGSGPELTEGPPFELGQWVFDALTVVWYLTLGAAAAACMGFVLLVCLPKWVFGLFLLLSAYGLFTPLVLGSQVKEGGIPLEPQVFATIGKRPGVWLATWLVPLAMLVGLEWVVGYLWEISFRLAQVVAAVGFGWWWFAWARWIAWCGNMIAPWLEPESSKTSLS